MLRDNPTALHVFLTALALSAMASCVTVKPVQEVTTEVTKVVVTPPVDMGLVPMVLDKYLSLGHVCPVAPRLALTAGHVIMDGHPLNPQPTLLTWGDSYGRSGVLGPVAVANNRDLGLVEVLEGDSFGHVFPVAASEPEVGETLYVVGYTKDAAGNFDARLVAVVLTRARAGHLFYAPGANPGSSGSCVLRKDGTVVGVNVGEAYGGEAGLGVSVVGPWALEVEK